MTEAQKIQRKKNILIISFMILLVIFVCLICYIFIYVKTHPKKEYVSQDSINVVEMMVQDYDIQTNSISFTLVTEPTTFEVTEDNVPILLSVNENKQVVKSETGEVIEIFVNDTNINNNIKVIYQNIADNIILTEDGKVYRLLDRTLKNKTRINAGQILANTTINNIVRLNVKTDDIYVQTSENAIVNINTQKEYEGIIKEITTPSGTIYVYYDYSFGLEKGKVITDAAGNKLKFTNFIDNKVIDENSVIYDVDYVNKKLSTSKLGVMSKIWYRKNENNMYSVTIEANTGIYTFENTQYYSR